MKTRIMLTAGLFALLAVTAAFGQPSSLRATVDFPFSVDGKVLPAGTYDFMKNEEAGIFKVTDEGKNEAAAQIETRLAAGVRDTPKNALVVFDKIGQNYVLSEIWIPGEDGFVLAVTKAKHEHKIINVKY